MDATIQGEFHTSNRDRRRLVKHGLDSYDALFIESSDRQVALEDITPGYGLFLMGYIQYNVGMTVFHGLRRFIPLLGKRFDLKSKVSEATVVCHDDTDVSLPELYEMVSPEMKTLSGIGISGLIVLLYYLIDIPDAYGLVDPRLVFGISLALAPCLYFALVVRRYSEARDAIIAESILTSAQENGYDRILILCGQDHVYGIEEILESEGWEVKAHDTTWAPLHQLLP